MKDNELIVCRDVSLGYEGRSVLSGLNLTISKGDYLCVVGDNGSGKSTLLKSLLGLLPPLKGVIRRSDTAGAVGYLPQQTRAQRDFPATVLEVVLSGCLNRQGLHFFYTPAQRSEAMMNLCKLGILELKDACYRDLSGGQQQRVAIARALAADPEIIYFDEPTSALDPELTGEVLSVMRQLAEEGMTMLVVTHEMGFARNVSSKTVFMENGVVVEQAPSQQFFASPKEERTRAFLRRIAHTE